MKSWISKAFPVAVIVLVVGVFFFRLFYPEQKLLLTPDFGRSDAWDFSYSMKYTLWEALHEKSLPLWDARIGTGFPLLAEGQTGALFFPNLILFLLPDATIAYNLALSFAILTLAFGTYWWARVLGHSRLISLFGALTLSFSGLPILHLTHITLLQAMSLFPAMAALTHLLITKRTLRYTVLLGVVGSQQIFAGFPQATFLTVAFCFLYAVLLSPKEKRISSVLHVCAGVFLAAGLGAVQLVPSWEFLRNISHPQGFDPSIASYFSFPLKHLITFLSPYALGNPKVATYPPFFSFDGSIFWENTAYIGTIPLLFSAMALFLGKQKKARTFGLLAGLSFVLAWGKYSPLYFLYSFFPFNLFRVPSRFLWITVFMLVFLAMTGIEATVRRIPNTGKVFMLAVLLPASVVLLVSTWWSYHLLIPKSAWLAKPASGANLSHGRVFTIGGAEAYNRIFLADGWQEADPYLFLRQGLLPNGNLVWDISQYQVTSGRILRRPSVLSKLLAESIQTSESVATFSSETKRYLDLSAIGTVLSFVPLTQKGLIHSQSYTSSKTTLHVFQNSTPALRVHLLREATVAASLEEALTILRNPSFDHTKTVLLEAHEVGLFPTLDEFIAPKTGDRIPQADLRFIKDTNHEVVIEVGENKEPGLLVLADTYYPGWTASVDGSRVPLLAANIAQRAVVVPPGSHQVSFRFVPTSFYQGAAISGFFVLLTILLTIGPMLSSQRRRSQKVLLRGSGRRHNHGR